MRKAGSSLWAGLLVGAIVAAAGIAAVWALARQDPYAKKGPHLGADAVYDLTELRKVDPERILYDQAATLTVPFDDARAIAVGPAGRVYVAAGEAIHVLDGDALARGFQAATRQVVQAGQTPRCLAADVDGTIYAGIGDRVTVFADGKPAACWPAESDGAILTSIVLDAANVFVADAHGRVILRYDKAGKLLGRIGRRDPARNITGLVVPSPYFDVAVAPDGLLRVVNPGECRVEAYTFDGDREAAWGEPGPGLEQFTGCCNPVHIAVLGNGRVLTCEKGLRRVKLYDAGGKLLGVVAPPSAFATVAPRGGAAGELEAAADASGRVLVLDPYDATIKVFTPKKPAPEGKP